LLPDIVDCPFLNLSFIIVVITKKSMECNS
jgi:hypothetical protein